MRLKKIWSFLRSAHLFLSIFGFLMSRSGIFVFIFIPNIFLNVIFFPARNLKSFTTHRILTSLEGIWLERDQSILRALGDSHATRNDEN